MVDRDGNSFGGRLRRYARVGAGVTGVAARAAGARLTGLENASAADAAALKAALGGLKGPLMKAAQIMATVPDLLPPEFAEELQQLQQNAPPMGRGFVRRRMAAELGPDWRAKFADFDQEAAAAASLGQVHRATAKDGRNLACKLQYPDMGSAIEADINQLNLALGVFRRIESSIDARELAAELADRLREELDYAREARHTELYDLMLSDTPEIHVPEVVSELSTARLLTQTWLEGSKVLEFKTADLTVRNTIARNMFTAWWRPLSRYGVIHGDPHLGNYTVRAGDHGLNLLDYGCVRIFNPTFVGGVIDLYRGLLEGDRDRTVHAYETWGFSGLSDELIETLNIWARFIYAPLLDDRVRTTADGVAPSEYGRKEAFEVRQRLKKAGPVTPPREFVFMDRAAIGLGSVFIHLQAEQNWHRLFEDAIDGWALETVRARQAAALAEARVPAAA
ncbi:MAG: AarF/ABC1/UbiB kinase family protein [Pseudomonadota bacterium]